MIGDAGAMLAWMLSISVVLLALGQLLRALLFLVRTRAKSSMGRPRSSEGRHSAVVAGRRWFAPVRGRFRSIAAATFGALAFYLAAMVLSLMLLETHARGIAHRADGAVWRFSPDAWSTRSNLRMTSAYKDPDSDLTSPPYGTYSIIRIFVGPSTRYRMPRQSTTRRRIEDNNAAG